MGRGIAGPLILYGIDISHARLSELMKLADAAKPFYDWVEVVCKRLMRNEVGLDDSLRAMTLSQIQRLIRTCYAEPVASTRPVLFDGAGRRYSHRKACYYFFSWIARDAPQQRLQPMIARASRAAGKVDRLQVEIEALASLLHVYRTVLGTFAWPAVREVICDRLEGSRRAIKGRQKEAVVRTAVAAAVQDYFQRHGSYGRFASVDIPDSGVRVGNEEFDVVMHLCDAEGAVLEQILFPVKTRETEGGGHSHIFTRDINSAITAARESDLPVWIAVFIIAQNWSGREQEHVQEICDFVVAIAANPTAFEALEPAIQMQLNKFVSGVLSGTAVRKRGR